MKLSNRKVKAILRKTDIGLERMKKELADRLTEIEAETKEIVAKLLLIGSEQEHRKHRRQARKPSIASV